MFFYYQHTSRNHAFSQVTLNKKQKASVILTKIRKLLMAARSFAIVLYKHFKLFKITVIVNNKKQGG